MANNDARARARELRGRAREMRANPTDSEHRLWAILRDRRLSGHKFRRQHVVGSCIVDFACLERRLVVEADGSQHADNQSDRARDAYLRRLGFRVLRFWNNDLRDNAAGVFDAHQRRTPHPSPFRRFAAPSLSPGGERGWRMTNA